MNFLQTLLKYKKSIAATTSILSAGIFFFWQNNDIVISEYDYENPKVPKEFNNFKILHISDFHNKQFGKNHKLIMKKIEKVNPNIIVITGDLIDRRRFHPEISYNFIEHIVKLAPVYYVSGNHERKSGHYKEIIEELNLLGVETLENDFIKYSINDGYINIIGTKDPPTLTKKRNSPSDVAEMENFLSTFESDNTLNILLSHKPELIDIYKYHNMDLIFSGHTHGGQFRIPFIGGIIAPNQGLFPKYDAGMYKEYNDTTGNLSTLFISRGLGNSSMPIRIFNRPELITVNLRNSDKNN